MSVLRWMAPLLSCRTPLISLPDGPKARWGFFGVSCDCCSMYMRGILGERHHGVPDRSAGAKVPWKTSAIFMSVRISWALDHEALSKGIAGLWIFGICVCGLMTPCLVFWFMSAPIADIPAGDRLLTGYLLAPAVSFLPLALCPAGEPAALPSPCRLRRCSMVPRRGMSWLRSALDGRLLKEVPRPWISDPQDDLGPGLPFISGQDSRGGHSRDRELTERFPHKASPLPAQSITQQLLTLPERSEGKPGVRLS